MKHLLLVPTLLRGQEPQATDGVNANAGRSCVPYRNLRDHSDLCDAGRLLNSATAKPKASRVFPLPQRERVRVRGKNGLETLCSSQITLTLSLSRRGRGNSTTNLLRGLNCLACDTVASRWRLLYGSLNALSLLIAALLLTGCGAPDERPARLFELLPETTTGVTFTNTLAEDPAFNILNYLYYYDGGGVAAGDVNGDGLVDLYFTANEQPNKLYLNKGDFVFEDVTEQAGVAGTAGWTKGVTMADVNGDGHLDIYVSNVTHLGMRGANALYVNNGDPGSGPGQVPTFTDHAEAYGLDHEGLSTQATFFDYDADGDLDVYLVNHSLHDIVKLGGTYFREERHPEAGDKLLRNDGERFTDVSTEAGIYGSFVGYGLAAMASDLNGDGCVDLYISNDFHENDYLYRNNCDGTFTETIYSAMGHTSLSSMGNDAADVNNDGRPDVVVVDMLPEREEILQTVVGAEDYDVYRIKLNRGYHHQFSRNTLQLNLGQGRFADTGYTAGITATDWSWAALLADLDNDGFKDLFITNGIYRRPNDRDYLDFTASPAMQATLGEVITADNLKLLDRMPQVPLANYAFRNDGPGSGPGQALSFTNKADDWGLAQPGFSNGAAYADLDNDGDLDLVVNNVGGPASIYKNLTTEQTGRHYLTVALEGSGGNTAGIGAKVILRHQGMMQMQEQSPTRGWQSSVDPRLHFGLGEIALIDTVLVVWPDGRFQTMTNVAADQLLTARQDDASGAFVYDHDQPDPINPLFEDVTGATALDFDHEENQFLDFTREPLMPHLLSTEGPALVVADVNGDGLDDVFAGGAKWQPARLLVQQSDGGFLPTNDALWTADSLHEDVDAAFFDADGDGDADLYVVSAGNEFWGNNDALRDRLYLNDGSGGFTRTENALPDVFANGCCVAPGDFDQDGDVDLFVGSRVVSRQYGLTPPSFLLENDGTGAFTDVTETRTAGLAEAGMITDAVWTDYDGDGSLDLIVVGEWTPIRVFAQRDGQFTERTAEAGFDGSNGWWNTVLAEDMDGDGDVDLVAGNLGRNSYLHAAPDEPARLTIGDFNTDGKPDQILTHYKNGDDLLFASRDDLIRQLPALVNKFPTYASFGGSRLDDVFTPEERTGATVKEAYFFDTVYAENNGDPGSSSGQAPAFTLRPLPWHAQLAPVHAILADDFDGDGLKDLMLAGNFDGVPPRRGRYDAGYGWLLRGDGQGTFSVIEPAESNLWIEGQARALRRLEQAGGARLIIAARNAAPLQVIRWQQPATARVD